MATTLKNKNYYPESRPFLFYTRNRKMQKLYSSILYISWEYSHGKAATTLRSHQIKPPYGCSHSNVSVINQIHEPKRHLDQGKIEKNPGLPDSLYANWQNELVTTWIEKGWWAKANIYHLPCKSNQSQF
jgi:hypothetical protein